tara:strand:+ start:85 stop:1056 length:972 start_codon:yes stop_codon:yes gene_type:complete
MKNILVTGGAGYIGSNIVEFLLRKNKKVVIIDNLSSGFKKLINKKAKFYNLNINNYNKVKKILINNNIDSVIHLAASISIYESNKNPKKFYNNNVTGTKNLVKACLNTTVKNFIFSSTAAVYEDTVRKVSENFTTKPKSTYGKTKLKAEKIIIKKFKNKNISYAILRYFNVVGASPSNKFGPIKKNDTLFKNLANEVLKKKPLFHIYGKNYNTKDGSCIRDYIHVYDISEIHIKVLTKINYNKFSVILNCGYGKGISVVQAVNTFNKIVKKKIATKIQKRRSGDLASSIAKNNKLLKFIKWKPKYKTLKSIVLSCIKWEKKLN